MDAVEAAGDTVLVHDADRLFVLDAANGRARGTIVSDDGAAVRAVAIALDDLTAGRARRTIRRQCPVEPNVRVRAVAERLVR